MKFYTGDVVRACKHWLGARELAVVTGCYRDLHAGNNEKDYALEFDDGRQAWFQAHQLELVHEAESGEGMRLLKTWRKAKYALEDAEDLVDQGKQG